MMSDDLYRSVRRQMAEAYQWQILREFIGNDVTAARIMAATPMLGGMPAEARDVLAEADE